jgi:hypothetical protein
MGAALRSLALPGWGQWALGQSTKAAIIGVGALLTLCGCGLINLLAASDAWALAKKRARGEAIGPYETGRLADWLGDLFG